MSRIIQVEKPLHPFCNRESMVGNVQNEYCDKKRIHDTCPVKDSSLKGIQTDAESKAVCKVRNNCKNTKSLQIFSGISCVIVSLTHKEPHDRRCQPADKMKRQRFRTDLKSRIKYIRKMIDRHRNDRNDFQRIGI